MLIPTYLAGFLHARTLAGLYRLGGACTASLEPLSDEVLLRMAALSARHFLSPYTLALVNAQQDIQSFAIGVR